MAPATYKDRTLLGKDVAPVKSRKILMKEGSQLFDPTFTKNSPNRFRVNYRVVLFKGIIFNQAKYGWNFEIGRTADASRGFRYLIRCPTPTFTQGISILVSASECSWNIDRYALSTDDRSEPFLVRVLGSNIH